MAMPREGKHRRPTAEELDEKLVVPLNPEEAVKGFLAVEPAPTCDKCGKPMRQMAYGTGSGPMPPIRQRWVCEDPDCGGAQPRTTVPPSG